MRELRAQLDGEDPNLLLRRLALLRGLENGYWDITGTWHELGMQSARAILEAMGADVSGVSEIAGNIESYERTEREELVPPVILVHREELPLSIPVRYSHEGRRLTISWEFFEEGGGRYSGVRESSQLARTDGKLQLNLPVFPSDGYHYVRLSLRALDEEDLCVGCRVIVCPNRCYLPDALRAGERWWGVGVQLPALRSPRNWGIGDFSDLREIGLAVAEAGGRFVGVNPLHALPPGGTSPYSPSSRFEVQFLAIDLESVPEFQSSAKVKSFMRQKRTQKELQALRSATLVDYARCGALKRSCLRLMFEEFIERHLEAGSDRAVTFSSFVDERGERLRRFAIHSALAEKFSTEGLGWAWPAWPEEFHDPHSPAVARFAEKYPDEIKYFQYEAWLAEMQLQELRTEFAESGLTLGCYGDLALGADPAGAENWIDRDIFIQGVSLGAPPDALGPLGQVWGLPALSPCRLRQEGYEPFAALVRSQMKRAGALRLDHVMQLFRLFLIPQGMQAKDGAYLRYPLHDLAGIVALESHRNRTVVIGEDLGTVPPEISRCMKDRAIFSYKVLYFEKTDGSFLPAQAFPAAALVVTSTHDLPTLRGYIEGHDIRLREALKLVSDEQTRLDILQRQADIAALSRVVGESPENFRAFNQAVHAFLATTPCSLQLIQLEDLLEQTEQCNVPGTVDEHPNWRRRYGSELGEVKELIRSSELLKAVATARSEKRQQF